MKKINLIISTFILTTTVSLSAQADSTQTMGSGPSTGAPTTTDQSTGAPATTDQSTAAPATTDQSTGAPATTDQSTAAPAQGTTGMPAPNIEPCHAIKAACKSAGYFTGGAKTGKGLIENCVKPLLAGQTVMGVTVNPSDAQACQAKHTAN